MVKECQHLKNLKNVDAFGERRRGSLTVMRNLFQGAGNSSVSRDDDSLIDEEVRYIETDEVTDEFVCGNTWTIAQNSKTPFGMMSAARNSTDFSIKDELFDLWNCDDVDLLKWEIVRLRSLLHISSPAPDPNLHLIENHKMIDHDCDCDPNTDHMLSKIKILEQEVTHLQTELCVLTAEKKKL
ncbi:hypothetical protein GEMRC1_003873 [Eukaryota sp. GEM-RC1]